MFAFKIGMSHTDTSVQFVFSRFLQFFIMSAKSLIREPPSGIDLLVVGAGIGGLSAAIECHRKGHNVRVIERRPDFSTFGLYISQPVVDAPCIPT